MPGDSVELEKLIQRCRSFIGLRLSDHRYRHSLGTWEKARELMRGFCLDIDPRRAAQACLLHDCAREASPGEIEKLLSPSEIAAVPGGAANVELLHGPAGARLVERQLSLSDPEVLDAIRFHVTGRPRPSLLLSLLIVSDFFEDGREFHEHTPRLFDFDGIENLAAEVVKRKIEWCRHCGKTVAEDAENAMAWYKERCS